MKGKGLIKICTVFLVIISMLAMNVPFVSAAVTYAPTITVTNNPTGTPDTVVVKGTTTSTVYANDVVKVYRVATSTTAISNGTLIGQAVASGTGKLAQATVTISQLGTTAGFIKVRVTPPVGSTNGTIERDVTAAKAYIAEKSAGITPTPVAASVYAKNYYNESDLVIVNGATMYPVGSVVKVYRSAASKVVLGRGEIVSGGNAEISIAQLGTRAGKVYVSVTKTVYKESAKLGVSYASEVSEALLAGAITVTNNHDSNPASPSDTVTITASKATGTKALQVGDVIKVYRGSGAGATLLGTSPALAVVGNVTIDNLSQDLGAKAGKLYVTRTSSGKKESAKTTVNYKAENTSKILTVTQVTYANNRYGTADTITVSNAVTSRVYEGCVIRVYEEIAGGAAMGITTIDESVPASYTITPTDPKFLDANGGSFYISIERPNENESNRTAIKYKGETPLTTGEMEAKYGVSTGSGNNNINGNAVITNNPDGTADTVVLTDTDLAEGDIVRLYTSSSTTADKEPIGETTAGSTPSPVTVSVKQLSPPTSVTAAVYMTITPVYSTESARYELRYITDTAYTGVTVTATDTTSVDGSVNDYIDISGLHEYDTVKVYDASTDGNLLGAGLVAGGASSVKIDNILLPAGGTIYVSITKFGAEENKNRLQATYTVVP